MHPRTEDAHSVPASALPLPLPLPQTKAGAPARGPTAEEFRGVVEKVKAAWREREGNPRANNIIFSWDNASIHSKCKDGQWEGLGVADTHHTMLPALAPDMHQVIELSHAMVVKPLQHFINTHVPASRSADNVKVYNDELVRLFKELITPDWVESTLRRLYTVTLPAILREKGDWPSKQER